MRILKEIIRLFIKSQYTLAKHRLKLLIAFFEDDNKVGRGQAKPPCPPFCRGFTRVGKGKQLKQFQFVALFFRIQLGWEAYPSSSS